MVSEQHAHERGDLIVAAAARAKFSAEFDAGPLDEPAFER
jgi:hypothetical protein